MGGRRPRRAGEQVHGVPTLAAFAPRFSDGHARANRQKPSGIAGKESILDRHLIPALERRRLDAIRTEDVQALKAALGMKAAKTVNNVLSVLSTLLKVAVEWDVIAQMPCRVGLLRVPKTDAAFLDFDEYERLVEAARALDSSTYLMVLLGGEAELRCSEMMALAWDDVDLAKGQLAVARSDWKGHVTATKGGRVRHVPLTARLATALRDHRHLRGPRVLCQADGLPVTQKIVQVHVRRAARKAKLSKRGVHILRHYAASRTMPSHRGRIRLEPRHRGAQEKRWQDVLGIVDSLTAP